MNINPQDPHYNLIASIDSLLNGKAIMVEYIPSRDHDVTIYTVLKLYLQAETLVYAEEFEGMAALLCRYDKTLNEQHILVVVYIPISEATIDYLFSLKQTDIAGEFKGQIILNFSDFQLIESPDSDSMYGYYDSQDETIQDEDWPGNLY